MKLKKNIVLVGMMGSGKSSIGKILSNKLNIKFIDIDKIIEEKENMTISKIFEIKGENYFRKIEEDTCLNILKLKNKIISLGGGSYINEKIRKLILKDCISIWLNWRDETIINRIKNSKKRPLVTNMKISEIKSLISCRSKIYNTSNFKINCDNLSIYQIANKIINYYENK